MDVALKPRTTGMKRSLVEEDEDAGERTDESGETEREGEAVGFGGMHEDAMEGDGRVRRHKGVKHGCGKTFCNACSIEDSARCVVFASLSVPHV